MSSIKSVGVSAFAFLAMFAVSTVALGGTAIAPASPPSAGDPQNVIPLVDGTMTYAVGSSGWSDTWLIPAVPVGGDYNQAADVLSGDDAPNLHYNVQTGGGPIPRGAGESGWLTSSLDHGTLAPIPVASAWNVLTQVAYTAGTFQAQSQMIQPADTLVATITTTIVGGVMTQTYMFQNLGANPITDVVFADYFNFHPNGSLPAGHALGTIVYDGGTLITTGGGLGFISNGQMSGQVVDNAHTVGEPNPVITEVQNNAYDMAVGPYTGDAAGALAWDLPNLLPGQSTDFTIIKAVPEPASISLLGFGCAALLMMVWRRRVRS